MTGAVATERKVTGVMCEMNASGDTKVIWDKDSPEEVAAARTTFNSLKAKGFAAFSVKKDGEKGTKISEFDPNAEKIILVPQIAGG